MKRQLQLIRNHDPAAGRFGDCYRTCVAIILGLDAYQVDHVCNLSDDHPEAPEWKNRMRTWLHDRGLTLAYFTLIGAKSPAEAMKIACEGSPDVPMILHGTGAGGLPHAVVIMNGKLWCDPAGTGGLIGPIDGPSETYSLHLIVPLWAEGD